MTGASRKTLPRVLKVLARCNRGEFTMGKMDSSNGLKFGDYIGVPRLHVQL